MGGGAIPVDHGIDRLDVVVEIAYLRDPGLLNSPSIMPVPKEIIESVAHKVGDPVHYAGIVHRVSRRYYRKSTGEILYDLVEVVKPGGIPRHPSGIPEKHVTKPTLGSLGLSMDR